jgi:TPR repeat protein
LAKAYYLVGIYIEKGIGTVEEEDPQLWFQRSAILGHKGAMEKLKQEEHSSH